jgi:hypothetical protein
MSMSESASVLSFPGPIFRFVFVCLCPVTGFWLLVSPKEKERKGKKERNAAQQQTGICILKSKDWLGLRGNKGQGKEGK